MQLDDMDDVREVLRQQIMKLDNGESNPAVANAIFNGVNKILSTVKLEMDYQRYINKYEGPMPLVLERIKLLQATHPEKKKK